jgi:hypothetical protein
MNQACRFFFFVISSFGRYLRMAEFHSARDIPLLAMRKAAGSGSGPRSISYNEAERSLIAFSDADGGIVLSSLWLLFNDATLPDPFYFLISVMMFAENLILVDIVL